MRLDLVGLLLSVIFLSACRHSEAATPMAQICTKVTNLISPFLKTAQIQTLVNAVYDMAWDKKTVDYIKTQIMPLALKTVNNAQKTQALNTYQKMSTELGGADKAEALLTVLMNKLTTVLDPYITQLQTVIKNQRSKGKATAKTATLKKSVNFITKANIQKAIDATKKAFTQKQCDVAFKYLAGTYLKLGLYNFKATPCTGKGA